MPANPPYIGQPTTVIADGLASIALNWENYNNDSGNGSAQAADINGMQNGFMSVLQGRYPFKPV